MATIDIGKIKPVFKGTYDNSTAYVLDDIVYYNGSSYVAKTSTTGNLPTDNTKWNLLASGSGGIWDSSLSIGSASQKLRVNSGGTGLEFFTEPTVTSGVKKVGSISKNIGINAGNRYRNPYVITDMNYTFTPTDTSAGGSTFVWNAKVEISHDNHPAGCIEVSEDGGSNWVNASSLSTTEGGSAVQSGGNLSWNTTHQGRYPSFAFDSNGSDTNRGSNGYASGIYRITGGSVTNLQWRMLVWSENSTPDLLIGGSANSGNTTHGSISLTNLTILEI